MLICVLRENGGRCKESRCEVKVYKVNKVQHMLKMSQVLSTIQRRVWNSANSDHALPPYSITLLTTPLCGKTIGLGIVHHSHISCLLSVLLVT